MFRVLVGIVFWAYVAVMAPFALFACLVAGAAIAPLVWWYEKVRR